MFGKKTQPPIKSLIAQGTRIEGNMKFNEGLRVDGEVIGDIQAPQEEASSLLVISEGDASPPPRPVFARAMKAEAVPIERGTETLEASVSVTWALK